MPMEAAEDFGTDFDGRKNKEYCQYCWQNGEFTAKMELSEFIETQIKIATKNLGMSQDEARLVAETTLPELKRWQKQ
jgi:hypothetical protein